MTKKILPQTTEKTGEQLHNQIFGHFTNVLVAF